ncbi:uncharacterized protein K452DRAFT_223664 [Aplosporella prunicola CBS 121167]|uniref:Amidase domain-containing protein n=1 Tax=Aplosporella prunicola CBS 121167 TaxID=1176127 RepID=A0A6A6BJB6_9PEZI|nr:uncharacterized protein K452DRAFT_223664 [Aplosporella prunicola CBS 121167]KAF2144249.1 hypothetical protein K452DRAFT_223664 [Aplosporella prunicola CBS 121167]
MDGLPFDPLTATASSLSQLLATGRLTSVELVDILLAQIDRHNRKGRQLRAIISVAPRYHLFAVARRLDDERKAGLLRGPLHGVPIVLQDNILTDPLSTFLDTTVGSYAFVGAKPKASSAPIVDRLLARGLVVLAKTNLSELCGLKSTTMRPGWSAVGGQSLSPFVARRREKGVLIWEHAAAGGAGAGAASAVAAGFAPLALASDTVGSTTTPANRAALYGLKPTVGAAPMDGVWALSRSFDTLAALAKSAEDLVALADALLEPEREDSVLDGVPRAAPRFAVKRRWKGLRVGFVDPAVWKPRGDLARCNADAQKYMVNMYEMAIAKIRDHGAAVSYPVQAPSPEGFRSGGLGSFEVVAYHEFRRTAADFFAHLDSTNSNVRNLAALIQFNADHADIELPAAAPDQDDLITAFGTNTPAPVVAHNRDTLRRLGGAEGIDLVCDYYGVDILAAPGDSALCDLAAAAGYPLATAPLGALRANSRPFGLALTGRAHSEAQLLHFLTAWESLFPASQRCAPPPLDSVPVPMPAGPDARAPAPDPPVIRVILREWDMRDFRQSSDALAEWLNARWRKSGYALSPEAVYEILKANGRVAFRGLGDESGGAFAR